MSRRSTFEKEPLLWLLAALLLCVGLKTWLIAGGWVPFNSDEAVVALMARHILQGANPTFFYGQAYMGSLDAYFVAAAFIIFGEEIWAIRLVQTILYLFFLTTVFLIGRRISADWKVGVLAVFLLSIPPVNLTLYTTVSLGGYGEALLIGNLIWLVSDSLARHMTPPRFQHMALWTLLGFLCGLGLWAFGLTLVYSLPAVILLMWESLRKIGWSGLNAKKWALGWLFSFAGFCLGSWPWWMFAHANGFSALLRELTGGAIAGVEGLPWLGQVGRHLANLLLFGPTVLLGIRPPWSVDLLALPLLPFVLIAWFLIFVSWFQDWNGDTNVFAARLMKWTVLSLTLAFIFSPFGADPSGRYFLPFAAPLSLIAARGILAIWKRLGAWAYAIAGILWLFQLVGNVQSAMNFPPGLTTQFYAPTQIDHRYDPALIEFLKKNGEKTGYSNYWVAYPLAFLSQEEIMFPPRLPYHLDLRYSKRDDRLPEYSQAAEQSPKTAYITTHNPKLDDWLRHGFSSLHVSWSEKKIGDYQVYYNLSSPVHPGMIGLGGDLMPQN